MQSMKLICCFAALLMTQAVPPPKPKNYSPAAGKESLVESKVKSWAESDAAASFTQKLVDQQCEDMEMVKNIGPVVKSISNFFQDKEKLTVYPWALTMLGALRWGGVSLFEQNKTELVDHDLDFLIQMPGAKMEDAREMVKAWQADLLKTTGLESSDVTGAFQNAARLPNVHDWDALHSEHFFIMVKKSSPLGDKLVDSHFEHDFFDRVHARPISELKVPDLANPLKMQEHALQMKEKIELGVMKQQFLDTIQNSEMYKNRYTLVDLWVKVDKLPAAFQAKPRSKTFFMGSTFSFPTDPEVIHKDILGVYKPDQKIWQTKSLCDLREPKGMFSEDVTASPHMTNLVKTCTSSLAANGYQSFQHCDQKKPLFGSLLQRAHKYVMGK